MSVSFKQLSNPFSTGGGGAHFEAYVQAYFVTLMLTSGIAPCLPDWPIYEIKLQGKSSGYNIDDLIVFVRNYEGKEAKLLAQIKRSIQFTKSSNVFREVIQDAWADFQNPNIFTQRQDLLALITGPLTLSDTNNVRTILEWARTWDDPDEYFRNVDQAKFSSKSKQEKLAVFRTHLAYANNGTEVGDSETFEFLRSFHLIGFDLDMRFGGTLSLLLSMIGLFSADPRNIWTRIVDEVQNTNKNAGTIKMDSVPQDLQQIFKNAETRGIPEDLNDAVEETNQNDWNQEPFALQLAQANLIGSWNEHSLADIDVVKNLISGDYDDWISKLRELLSRPGSPLSLRNGKWEVKHRIEIWESLRFKIFDTNLSKFKDSVISVLTELDPQFDLSKNDRFAAPVYGKVLKYSTSLRKGLSESVALLGSQRIPLPNCTQNHREMTANSIVSELLVESDWVRWGSLDRLLPELAEAAPDVFLLAVEKGLQTSPCPFDELFEQEGDGITGRSYITGLLWALEALAWEEKHLVRVCVLLSSLAEKDPGGRYSNRPFNSLIAILLPWYPQTMASISKRQVAIETILDETPSIGWKLLMKLLPKQRQSSTGTYKPRWFMDIPQNWEPVVKRSDYDAHVSFISNRAVESAKDDVERLSELTTFLDVLPKPAFEKTLKLVNSKAIKSSGEDKVFRLWENLTSFILKHRRYSNAEWALKEALISRIETAADKISPKDPKLKYRRLFTQREFDLYEETGDWHEQKENLNNRRINAVNEIRKFGGNEAIIEFVSIVESPALVGEATANVADQKTDSEFLPSLLKTKNPLLSQFVAGYAWGRQRKNGWEWVDELDKSKWNIAQKAQLLSKLPFTQDAWNRAEKLLGAFEKEYWINVNAVPYDFEADSSFAIQKLIDVGRPRAAVDSLSRMIHSNKPFDSALAVRALLSADSSEESIHQLYGYEVVEIIKAIQGDPSTDRNELLKVEWAYLQLLDEYSGTSPREINTRLAADPSFFCEVVSKVYRSKSETKTNKGVSKVNQAVASNAFRLLNTWKTPPGTETDGGFSSTKLGTWLRKAKEFCAKSGRLDVAMNHVGQVLYYSPPDPDGLWIHKGAAKVLNSSDAGTLRLGFRNELINSRGAYWVDPTGKPERELAKKYQEDAEAIENAGFHRLARTLRQISSSYSSEAERARMQQEHDSSD